MTKTPCHDAFDNGQAFRQRVPLRAGAYKISEAVSNLGRMSQCVGAIGAKIKRGEKFDDYEELHGCLGHERGRHLKRMPRSIADILGKMIVPGIAELSVDGVPPSEVARAHQRALSDVQDLLWDCEKAHQRLQQGIGHEYDAMRHGGSHLLGLLHRAEDIGQRALALVDAHNTAA